MPLELWLAYLTATIIVLAIPGPTIMLVVGYALADGARSTWRTVPGVALGDLTALTVSLAGLGAVLAASAVVFTMLKWIGAAYLVYLGVKMWRAKPAFAATAQPDRARASWSMTGHAFAVTALNPKSILFFVAFVPQFITPAAPLVPQMLVIGTTFLVLAIVNAAAYGLLAARIRAAMGRPGALKAVNRVGGSILIGAGAMTAAFGRAA